MRWVTGTPQAWNGCGRSGRSASRARRTRLDGQALAALGAASVDHGTAATGFHANEKTVCTGAANFGGLVSAFHDGSSESDKEPEIIANKTPCWQVLGANSHSTTSKMPNSSFRDFPRPCQLVDNLPFELQWVACPKRFIHNFKKTGTRHERGQHPHPPERRSARFVASLPRRFGPRHPRTAVQHLDPPPRGAGVRRRRPSHHSGGQPLQNGLGPHPIRPPHQRNPEQPGRPPRDRGVSTC